MVYWIVNDVNFKVWRKYFKLMVKVKKALVGEDGLRKSFWRNNKKPYAGHCYVASEALYHLCGGKRSGLKPKYLKHEGTTHWYLDFNGNIFDPTVGQFNTKPDYSKGKGCGFLTSKPSKRAMVLIKKIKKKKAKKKSAADPWNGYTGRNGLFD